MEDISAVSFVPLTTSKYLTPLRMNYTQDGKPKVWDLMKSHSSVAVVIFNVTTKKFIFVQQFRPAVFMSRAGDLMGNTIGVGSTIDTEVVKGEVGLTLELCAGIIDKDISVEEIAREEVREECGYLVPVENMKKIVTFPAGVGASGGNQTIFYVEVTSEQKVEEGGGVEEEGEMISTIEMGVEEVKKYISQETVNSPVGLLFGVQWYLANRVSL
eukprot:GFUD01005363.1.p1 GENE.GFUD01005363.1~~GFUD01005363.1.p1  ORF type:complete len:227 (+),score=91.03 GFUD01005363.1:40-681(+)